MSKSYIAEIISIGTELLLGEIVDTNAQYLSEQLAMIGISCHFRTTVGDNKSRIQEAICQAMERADIIITTGGLGPTDDDITIGSIADFFQEKLVIHQDSLHKIRAKFLALQKEMPLSNEKQAYFPESATVIENTIGTAPGILWERGEFQQKKYIMTFPGVPVEMKQMFIETAKPFLENLHGKSKVFLSRSLKTFGIQEAKLAEMVKDILYQDNPTVAPMAGKFEARLRMTASASTREAASLLIDETEQKIRSVINEPFIYGYDEDQLEDVIGKLLIQFRKTVSVAESCTGGLVSSRLTNISGSSAYIRSNLVTYSNEAKIKFLNVPEKDLEIYGAVSPEVAANMAEGIRKFSQTDYGIAITGIAGPAGGTVEKPVGLAYVAISDQEGTIATKILMSSTFQRSELKWAFSQHCLNLLRLRLLQQDVSNKKD